MKFQLTAMHLVVGLLTLIAAIVSVQFSFQIAAWDVQLDEMRHVIRDTNNATYRLVSNPQTTIDEQKQSFQDMKDIKAYFNITNSSLQTPQTPQTPQIQEEGN